MSLHEYRRALELYAADEPFYALVMAAMLGADDGNTAKLRAAFPDTRAELERRYNAGGGLLPSEAGYDEVQAARAELGLPPS